jgi:DNA-binding transcriptional regulator YiaG
MNAIIDTVDYTSLLPDGRTLFLHFPANETEMDRDGKTLLLKPAAVRRIDRARALAMRLGRRASPAHIKTLRQASGRTQEQLAAQLDVAKLAVSRWERGEMKPRPNHVGALERLRDNAVREGVAIDA